VGRRRPARVRLRGEAEPFLTHIKRLREPGPPLTRFYVRRHGTRRHYGGSYTERMLRQDAVRIRAWRRQGRDVFVYFNNDARAAAVRNALRLAELLGVSLT
jgi:uncharacterized protein YecE (DUF72 family)